LDGVYSWGADNLISKQFLMRKYIVVSFLLFLNICCVSESSRFVLQDTTWRFVSFEYDSDYVSDTFERFTNQEVNRLRFTRDSLFIISNDSTTHSVKYSIKSDILFINSGRFSNKLIIRKLSKDTLSLYDTTGRTYIFSR
jgi:hypothetical protein